MRLLITAPRDPAATPPLAAPAGPAAPPPPRPTKALAMSIACCASDEELTAPDRSTEAPEERTSKRPPGMLWLSSSRRVPRLRSRATVTSRAAIWRPSASMMKIEVAPSAMPITKTLRVERTTALATAGLATNTSLASRGRSTMTERPAVSSTRRVVLASAAPTVRTGAGPKVWRSWAEAGPLRAASRARAPAERRRGPRSERRGGRASGSEAGGGAIMAVTASAAARRRSAPRSGRVRASARRTRRPAAWLRAAARHRRGCAGRGSGRRPSGRGPGSRPARA